MIVAPDMMYGPMIPIPAVAAPKLAHATKRKSAAMLVTSKKITLIITLFVNKSIIIRLNLHKNIINDIISLKNTEVYYEYIYCRRHF